MTPDPVVITGEICGSACFLAVVAAGFVLFLKRLKLTKLTAAQQDSDRKPPPDDTEPTAAGLEIVSGGNSLGMTG